MVVEQGLLEATVRNPSLQIPSLDRIVTEYVPSHMERALMPSVLQELSYSNHWDVTSQQRAWLGCPFTVQDPQISPQSVNQSSGGNKHYTGWWAVQPRALGTSRMTADYKPSAWQLVLRVGSFRFASTSLNHKAIIKSQQGEQSLTPSAPDLNFSMQTSCWYWNLGLPYFMMLIDWWLGL